MIYTMYQAQADTLRALQLLTSFGAALSSFMHRGHKPVVAQHVAAFREMLWSAGLSHERPAFGIEYVRIGNRDVPIIEVVADETPFGSLLHFRKDHQHAQPRVLVVAPMSGHFSTLLRGTINVLLPDHDVFITDWKNAREIPLREGAFGLDSYISHIMRFINVMGPGGHVLAVCQPTVPTLAAVALLAQDASAVQPRSMTLMAGPVDTRIGPTKVNELAKSRPIEWFERNLISSVPWRYKGAHRRVYPGFLQLSAFVMMNVDRHAEAHFKQFRALASGDHSAVSAHRSFYSEYNAVMDLPAEFYLETVQRIFQDHDFPLGRFRWEGEAVEPAAIRRTALFTVEGERDDICSVGQTLAAQDLCSGIRPSLKRHLLQPGVGHYGVFSGKRWASEIYPRVRETIQMMS
jgi:poly(3-hydroxybutyrate) depolymerase